MPENTENKLDTSNQSNGLPLEGLRKKIAILDACWNECGDRQCEHRLLYKNNSCPYLTRKNIFNYEKADQILKLVSAHLATKRLVELDKDQTLPRSNIDIHTWRNYTPGMAYIQAQQDMLKAGFVKVVEK